MTIAEIEADTDFLPNFLPWEHKIHIVPETHIPDYNVFLKNQLISNEISFVLSRNKIVRGLKDLTGNNEVERIDLWKNRQEQTDKTAILKKIGFKDSDISSMATVGANEDVTSLYINMKTSFIVDRTRAIELLNKANIWLKSFWENQQVGKDFNWTFTEEHVNAKALFGIMTNFAIQQNKLHGVSKNTSKTGYTVKFNFKRTGNISTSDFTLEDFDRLINRDQWYWTQMGNIGYDQDPSLNQMKKAQYRLDSMFFFLSWDKLISRILGAVAAFMNLVLLKNIKDSSKIWNFEWISKKYDIEEVPRWKELKIHQAMGWTEKQMQLFFFAGMTINYTQNEPSWFEEIFLSIRAAFSAFVDLLLSIPGIKQIYHAIAYIVSGLFETSPEKALYLVHAGIEALVFAGLAYLAFSAIGIGAFEGGFGSVSSVLDIGSNVAISAYSAGAEYNANNLIDSSDGYNKEIEEMKKDNEKIQENRMKIIDDVDNESEKDIDEPFLIVQIKDNNEQQ